MCKYIVLQWLLITIFSISKQIFHKALSRRTLLFTTTFRSICIYRYICMYMYVINDRYRHYYEFHKKSLLHEIIRITDIWKVVHSIALPNIQTNKDLLNLSDGEAPGCWVFEPPPASQSAAILGENTKQKTLHLPIQKENSHNCLPTLEYGLPVQIIYWNTW